ncbi:MAG: ATP-binding protein [Desulforhopalus sp.]
MSITELTKSNLSKRLTVIVVVVAILLGFILSGLYLVGDYLHQKTVLEATIDQIVAVSKPSLTEVAYKIDRDGAGKIAHGLLEYEFIVEVEIRDEFDNVLTRKTGNANTPSATAWFTKLMTDEFTRQSIVLRDPDIPEYSYGTLNFTVNNDIAYQHFYQRSTYLVFFGIMQNLLLAAILLCIFYLLLTRPLMKIARGLARFDPETINGARIKSLPLHQNDEVGEIIRTANELFEKNEFHLKRRQQMEEEKRTLEQQLRHSQKIEAIGTLAGGIAHDFNNLLSIIIGFAEMAKDSVPESSPALKDIQEILNACEKAKELVRQILAFSRKNVTKKTYLRIGPLVEQALNLLRSSISPAIDIQSEIDPDCGGVLADTSQIIQVILNLCTNAAQAMEEDGGVLKVSLRGDAFLNEAGKEDNTVPKVPYVRLTVSDTGPGINENILDKIFDPYFTTKEFGKGTGMGLAMVHGIVKSHDGSIEVHSTPGEGATFIVSLPQAESEAEASVQ